MISKKNIFLQIVICFTAFLMVVIDANATIITTNFAGKITFAEDNSFGISTSSEIFGSVTFDDLLVKLYGYSDIIISSDPLFSLSVSVGGLTFNETQDLGYSDGIFPIVYFNNGNIYSLDFLCIFDDIYLFYSGYEAFKDVTIFTITNLDGDIFISGEYYFPSQLNSVPLPSTMILLSSSLSIILIVRFIKLDKIKH